MFARLVAFVCISQFGLCSHLSEPVGPPLHPVVVYLKGAGAQNASTLNAAKQELSKILRPAGYSVEFRTSLEQPVEGSLVVMEFRGECNGQPIESSVAPSDLATTSVVQGRVLPFTKVQCSMIRQTVGSALAGVTPGMRDVLVGRSVGRVMAHELYHILANETHHSAEGVAKTSFSSSELLGAHFHFDEVALGRITTDRPVLSASEEE